MQYFTYELIHKSKKSDARVGRIHTPHGIITTPNFVAVGTNATLKAIDSQLALDLGLELMFCNTYHLLLQPGTKLIADMGGLHKFMNRNAPIITDSGGFQVFSLAYGTVKDELKSKGQKKNNTAVLKINEEGVLFRSYRDGNKILLTPESSIQAQKELGADIIIPFDELPPYHIDEHSLKQSLDRTHRWEKRSLEEHLKNRNNQAIYSVIHGGINEEMRIHSSKFLADLSFDGHAIGGSLGKNHQQMFQMLNYLMPHLPKHLPNHLLGIGDIASLEPCIKLGVDTFDSSHPTRCARHGLLFSTHNMIKILNSSSRTNFNAPDPHCTCYLCKNYTMAYLHHLFKAKELTGYYLATIHNLHFMIQLMKQYQQMILDNLI